MIVNVAFNDIRAQLKQSEQQLFDNLFKGVDMAAYRIEEAAKQRCPTNTGNLKNHITHVIDGSVMAMQVRAKVGVAIGGSEGDMNYPIYVHEGTGIFSRTGSGRKDVPWYYMDEEYLWHSTEGMEPTPFLEDAYNAEGEEAKKDIAAWITKGAG